MVQLQRLQMPPAEQGPASKGLLIERLPGCKMQGKKAGSQQIPKAPSM